MAVAEPSELVIDDTPIVDPKRRGRGRRWAKRLGWTLAIIVTPLILLAAFLTSPIGKRFIADQIAQVAPASGLRFEVGRIEGDIYNEAVLHDVVLSDPKGVFARIPLVELDWRPLAWLWSGLDVRELSIRRASLERLPELLPGDPDAPLLPDFDIRIDRFEVENLMIARGIAGDSAQRVDLLAEVDIREGRALVDAEGRLGPEDRFDLLLDVEPEDDKFDLAFDYRAAKDGPIAAIAGLDAAYRARIEGEGTWSRWLGHGFVAKQVGSGEDARRQRVAAFRIANRAGRYGIVGQYYPLLDDGSIVDRALGDAVSLKLAGTFADSVLDGRVQALSSAFAISAGGVVDLADNEADDVEVLAVLRDPDLLGDTARFEGTRFAATIDGEFRDLTVDHRLSVERLSVGDAVTARGLVQDGTATYDGTRFVLPLDARVARVVSGSNYVDPRLKGGTLRGTLTYTGDRLLTDQVRIAFPGLDARLTLRGDLGTGKYAIAGPIEARGIAIPDVGRVSGRGDIRLGFGGDVPYTLAADVRGRLSGVTNATVANLAGEQVDFSGALRMGGNRPIALDGIVIDSARLDARLDSRIENGRTILAGSGSHVEYGDFTFDGVIDGDGPRGELVLASPLPAADLTNVRVALAPTEEGFALDVSGGSLLGAFDGELAVVLPQTGPTRLDIDRLRVYRTTVTGALTLGEGGVAGNLALNGGGLDGRVSIAPGMGDAQLFDADLTANNARFDGDTKIVIGRADIDASGRFGGGNTTVTASVNGSGLRYGALSIASFNADADIDNGRGKVTAAIAGRRRDRFALKLAGGFTPERITAIAQGQYAGRDITMPRRAVLTSLDGGGYRIAPTQIGYAGGYTIAEGRVGGGSTAIEAKLARMPLRLADIAGAELGLGGRLSGILQYNQRGDRVPVGNARVRIDDFTRSGLVLSSRPIDVYMVADLRPDRLVAGARLRDDASELGRFDARITGLPRAGELGTRLGRGRLNASLRYEGAAESLWRLAAIETFDLTGPMRVEARATGTLDNPRISGNLASDDLRLQSAVSGTDIDDVTARGRFAGSRLEITRFAGTTARGGTISGSGTVDLAQIGGGRGPRIDLRAAAKDARLLNANGLDATITGPLRIVSNGLGGTIAGRVEVDRATWQLATADEDRALPRIATREINGTGITTSAAASDPGDASWRYLIDARAPSRISVDGMGLESEWGIDIALRGTVDDPRLGGEARLVRGDYTFAGTRFELTRGRIAFDRDRAIDPRLDIEAQTSANGTDVTIDITGNAQSPEIAFSSTPALPQEEILARLLFGGSVTSLSATDALQLGAALASFQGGGGGGLDPIGDLRRSIGLDQLRIVSADPALGRGTGVALGKNLGRKFYVELVTDGQGYTATQLEYRVTRWLALLATVTTIGRDSALVEVSRDY